MSSITTSTMRFFIIIFTLLVLLTAVLLWLTPAVGQQDTMPHIKLVENSDRPLDPHKSASQYDDIQNNKKNAALTLAETSTPKDSLVFGIPASHFSNDSLYAFSQLMAILETQSTHQVTLKYGDTYADIVKKFQTGRVDFAMLSDYAMKYHSFGADNLEQQLIARPVPADGKNYHALIVTRQGLNKDVFNQLEGTTFAFTDPLSTTGHLYPLNLIDQYGLPAPAKFFDTHFFTYCPEQSLLSVASGVADAASTNSIAFDNLQNRKPDVADQLEVMHTSTPFNPPALLALPHVEQETKVRVRDFFQEVHQQEKGEKLLERIGWEYLDINTR